MAGPRAEMQARRDECLLKIMAAIDECWYPHDKDRWPTMEELR